MSRFTRDARATFELFGWSVYDENDTHALVGDAHFGPVLVEIDDLNAAALDAGQRQALEEMEDDCGYLRHPMWDAHTSWCGDWGYLEPEYSEDGEPTLDPEPAELLFSICEVTE